MPFKFENKELDIHELISLLMGKVDKDSITVTPKSYVALKHHFDSVVHPMHLALESFLKHKEPAMLEALNSKGIKELDGYAIVPKECYQVLEPDKLEAWVRETYGKEIADGLFKTHPKSNAKFLKENYEKITEFVVLNTTTEFKKVK